MWDIVEKVLNYIPGQRRHRRERNEMEKLKTLISFMKCVLDTLVTVDVSDEVGR